MAVSPAGLEIRRPMPLAWWQGVLNPQSTLTTTATGCLQSSTPLYISPHRGGGPPPPGAIQTGSNPFWLIFPIGKRIVSASRRSWESSPGHDGPSWPQDGPKMAQDGPRWPQDGPRMAPGWPKMAQDGPRMAQDVPRMAPRWSQDGSKTAQHGPRMAPSCPSKRIEKALF